MNPAGAAGPGRNTDPAAGQTNNSSFQSFSYVSLLSEARPAPRVCFVFGQNQGGIKHVNWVC